MGSVAFLYFFEGNNLDARDGAYRIHAREETCIQRFGRETGMKEITWDT
jgi:hypothetical protein